MKKLLAFSLIELMISLITISCIIAAFAPVVTKKLKNSNVTVALSEITTKCDKFTDECSLCYSSKCVACSRYCYENQYKNIATCLCENCTDRSVGCIRCDAKVCKKCDLGYGLTADGKCRLCPAGYYSDGSSDCKPCSAGQYQSEQGKATCKECPLGQYQNEQGKTSCIKCPLGQYQDEQGATDCKKCPLGQYQNVKGKTACINCPAGQFQNESGKSGCKACSSKTANCTSCDISTGTCNSCGGGYMISGTSCVPKYSHTKTANGTVQYINIDNSTFNVVVASIIGAGGGGGGGNVKTTSVPAKSPSSQADCDAVGPNLKFLTNAQTSGMGASCVTKYNAGDGSFTIPPSAGVDIKPSSQANRDAGPPQCWTGVPTRACNYYANYSGCGRTLCTFSAAQRICASYTLGGVAAGSWTLPSSVELQGWAANINAINTNQGANGLQLCDSNNSNGHALCEFWNGDNNYGSVWHCTYAFNSAGWRDFFGCYSNAIYSASFGTWLFYDNSISVRGAQNGGYTAAGVRCVLKQVPASTTETPTIGGGGGSGYSASNIVIPDSTIASARGGKIRLTAGTGGAGGAMGNNGGNGNATKVEVLNASGGVIWTKAVTVGSGGKTATAAANGAGGAGAAPGATGGAGGGSGHGAGGAGGSGRNNGANGAAGYISVTYQDANP